jgi:spore maturation protein CgeB
MSSWSDKGNQPSNKLLKLVRKQLGIRVVVLWWDTCSRDFANYHLQHFSCADINVVMDNPSLEHLSATIEHPQQVISMWTPQTPRMFQKIDTKDIDLVFLGQISNYRSNRAEYIDHLNASLTELNLYISTNDRTYQPSHAEYASILSRSKMSVNFSYSVDCHQLKGRVFDVMLAGGLLFESENAQITRLFCPMEDYVPFTSKEDLVEKIKYFHRNQEQLNKIAQNARAKVLAMYSPKIFWSKVLGEAGCI